MTTKAEILEILDNFTPITGDVWLPVSPQAWHQIVVSAAWDRRVEGLPKRPRRVPHSVRNAFRRRETPYPPTTVSLFHDHPSWGATIISVGANRT